MTQQSPKRSSSELNAPARSQERSNLETRSLHLNKVGSQEKSNSDSTSHPLNSVGTRERANFEFQDLSQNQANVTLGPLPHESSNLSRSESLFDSDDDEMLIDETHHSSNSSSKRQVTHNPIMPATCLIALLAINSH